MTALTQLDGVTIESRENLEIASVLARRGQQAALAARFQECFGLTLPTAPRRATSASLSLLGIGPGSWLAIREREERDLLTLLRSELGGFASFSDQGDAYVVCRISGPDVREVLSRLVAIDTHSLTFHIGDVAVTQAGHIAATLWRLPDGVDGYAVFDIAVYRSYAETFSRALMAAAYCSVRSVVAPM